MAARVVWSLSLGFLAGVFARSVFDVSLPHALLFALVAAISILFALGLRKNMFVVIAMLCAAISAGILRMDAARIVADPVLAAQIGTHVTLNGHVVEEPDVRDKSVRLTVRVRELVGATSSTVVDAKVLVVAPAHTELSYGDAIEAEGELRYPEAFETGSGRVFNYPMFLAKDGVLFELAFATVEVRGENRGHIFKRGALSTKHWYLSGLHRSLPEPEAGLAGGITLGDKRAISDELSGAFQTSSLIHIIVLSGYNMSVVINAAAHALAFLPRYGQFAASGVIVAVFILMTGGAASATRAGAMALIATYARLAGREFIALRVLAVVAFAMALWNPYLVAFDPGFQLSVLATAGLILLTPYFEKKLSFIPARYGLREIVASTCGTQIFVLPLILYQNGLLSFVAIPANFLALVAVPFAMLFSFVAAIGGLALGPLSPIIALPALGLLAYIIKIAEFFASLPHASVIVPSFSAWFVVAAYVGIALLVWRTKETAVHQTTK